VSGFYNKQASHSLLLGKKQQLEEKDVFELDSLPKKKSIQQIPGDFCESIDLIECWISLGKNQMGFFFFSLMWVFGLVCAYLD